MIKILYIDDNKSMTDLFLSLGKDYQFSPLVAHSVKEGLSIAKNAKPDVIITDIYMPDGNGFSLTATLKSDLQTHDIPVIGCTNSFFKKEKKILMLGAHKMVKEKPFSIEKLNAILDGIAPRLEKNKNERNYNSANE